ncbi:hypothetical protein Rruber_05720 (plasmid) [Rhodococcus ruber]|uniref:hypothetical protein n=1 Tax=Rhodococcus ruber TaxID=1830 RepID=UPI000346E792|nr:hypothetical protein [Rhodococcus ruber]
MQRSESESVLLDSVLAVIPISDLALEAAVAGVPVLDVPRSAGIDICFADKPDMF